MRKYSKNDFSKKELMIIIEKLQNENKKIEKALDKACDELAKQNDGEYWKKSESFETKEEWKSWCFE